MHGTSTDHRLAPHEAEALWRNWSVNHDKSARDRLVLAYSPMVNYLASRKVRELPPHCELDDLVFDTDLTHLILGTLAQDFAHPGVWDHWFAYISRIGTTLRMCDAAITTNPQLAKKISDFSGKPSVSR